VEILRPAPVSIRPKLLQWGHDFSAVEITWQNVGSNTSIELQWGHDFSAVEMGQAGELAVKAMSFNGATTFQPWKSCWRWSAQRWALPASMGPRLFSRGNTFSGSLAAVTTIPLQWGHDFSAVEIELAIAIRDELGNPLQWGHDFSAVEIFILPGRPGLENSFNGATTFQPWK